MCDVSSKQSTNKCDEHWNVLCEVNGIFGTTKFLEKERKENMGLLEHSRF